LTFWSKYRIACFFGNSANGISFASVSFNSDISFFSPFGSPLIFANPVINSVFRTITNKGNTMGKARTGTISYTLENSSTVWHKYLRLSIDATYCWCLSYSSLKLITIFCSYFTETRWFISYLFSIKLAWLFYSFVWIVFF